MRSINKMAKLKTLNHFSKNRFSSFRSRTTEEGGTGVRTEAALEAAHACQSQHPGKREEDARGQPALPGKVLFQNQTKRKKQEHKAQVTDASGRDTKTEPELPSRRAMFCFSGGPQPGCISEVGSELKTVSIVRRPESFPVIICFVVVVVFCFFGGHGLTV